MSDSKPLSPEAEAAPLLWSPRHGQWVLFRNGFPWSHRTAAGLAVGIFQKDSPIIDPTTGRPYMRGNLPVYNPRHIVPVDANGRGYLVDRLNFLDAKGATVLLPGAGLLSVDNPKHVDILAKHFSENRLSELQAVTRLEDCGLVGPLTDRNDMPPGRVVKEGYQPRP